WSSHPPGATGRERSTPERGSSHCKSFESSPSTRPISVSAGWPRRDHTLTENPQGQAYTARHGHGDPTADATSCCGSSTKDKEGRPARRPLPVGEYVAYVARVQRCGSVVHAAVFWD